jgi:hypothetical protein
MTAFHIMILSELGDPLIPTGGSLASRLKSRIRRRLAAVDYGSASRAVVGEMGRRWGVMMRSGTNGHHFLMVSTEPLGVLAEGWADRSEQVMADKEWCESTYHDTIIPAPFLIS